VKTDKLNIFYDLIIFLIKLDKYSSPLIRIRKEKSFVNPNSFYKNKLKNIHNLDSNLDSGNIESINENDEELDILK
jgi:hypothetical protein